MFVSNMCVYDVCTQVYMTGDPHLVYPLIPYEDIEGYPISYSASSLEILALDLEVLFMLAKLVLQM